MSALLPPASTPLESVPGLGEGLVEKLGAAGITTVEALADMTPEQLEAIEGIGPKTVEKISLAVNNYFSSLEGGDAARCGLKAKGGEAALKNTERRIRQGRGGSGRGWGKRTELASAAGGRCRREYWTGRRHSE